MFTYEKQGLKFTAQCFQKLHNLCCVSIYKFIYPLLIYGFCFYLDARCYKFSIFIVLICDFLYDKNNLIQLVKENIL